MAFMKTWPHTQGFLEPILCWMKRVRRLFSGYRFPPPHNCPMCGRPITDVKKVGTWKGHNNSGGGAWFNGICAACGIDFRLHIGTGMDSKWQMLAPDRESLLEPITAEELERFNQRLARFDGTGQKWRDFLAKRRDSDEVWRFRRPNGVTGLAIVRNGFPIAEIFASLRL